MLYSQANHFHFWAQGILVTVINRTAKMYSVLKSFSTATFISEVD